MLLRVEYLCYVVDFIDVTKEMPQTYRRFSVAANFVLAWRFRSV
jgi:hypothetical protein